MKIRNRITLWITGAGLLAAFIFSAIVFHELIEQPLELLDRELESQAYTLLVALSPGGNSPDSSSRTALVDSLARKYWIKVYTRQQNLLYSSNMARSVDLPAHNKDERYNVIVKIPENIRSSGQVGYKDIPFRVGVFAISFGGQEYFFQIAKSMEHLQDELNELIIAIGIGLIVCTLSLILFGYFAAGRILKPVTAINSLAREISEKTLDKRIPLGATQDELYTLSSSLNQMFDRLQFSFKRQKEFIANASHELKTPIAMQRLFFDEALQLDVLPENFKTKLVIQSGITLRMNQLVKNLLDLSALEQSEELELQSLDLTELATSVLEEFDESIWAAGIRLSLNMEESVLLSADKEKIRRVLINLIDNAIKYNLAQDGEIRFSLSRTGNRVQLEISNTGQEIPKGELSRVFKQFYRVEKSRATGLGGSGLGLTLVKRIVELHNGTIELESVPESWTQVTIILPS